MENKKKNLNRAEKRKIEYRRRSKKMKKSIISIIAILAVISFGIVYVFFLNGEDNTTDKTITTKSNDDSEIRIPFGDLSTDAKFYSYDFNDVSINYFAVLGSDGNVHVALDACDVCYGAKKGYKQIDNVMHCINCGREFPINSIGTSNTAGGCWPSYIPIKIDSKDVIISTSDLEAKRYMF